MGRGEILSAMIPKKAISTPLPEGVLSAVLKKIASTPMPKEDCTFLASEKSELREIQRLLQVPKKEQNPRTPFEETLVVNETKDDTLEQLRVEVSSRDSVIRDLDKSLKAKEATLKQYIKHHDQRISKMESKLREQKAESASQTEINDKKVIELHAKNQQFTLELGAKEKLIEKEKNETKKVKDEWSRKVQKCHDKTAEIEEKLKAKEEQYNSLELDNQETLKALGKANRSIAKHKETWTQNSERFTAMRESCQSMESKLFPLRSSDEAEKDRIKAAVRSAKAPLDAEIVELRGLLDSKDDELTAWKRAYNEKSKELSAALGEVSHAHYERQLDQHTIARTIRYRKPPEIQKISALKSKEVEEEQAEIKSLKLELK